MEASSLRYTGQVNVRIDQSPAKDALYFSIELENTVWTPFLGQHNGVEEQSFLNKWFWDPITPLYNPLVTLINRICSAILGKRPLTYHMDQASAFKALERIRRTYEDCFGTLVTPNELQGLERIYCTEEGMANYMDGRPRTRATALGILLRDAARPIATSLPEEVRQLLPYYSFPTTSTPWTGMVGRTKDKGEFVGRIANGGGRREGYSESGMIYSPEMRNKGLGKEATFALLIHAWLFSTLKFPVGKDPVTHFTATVSPYNRITSGLAREFCAEVLQEEINPYDPTSVRHLYGIRADLIDGLLRRIIPDAENQITINGQKRIEFFRALGVI